nr:tyrosine-type recombinase/integrase [Mesorhizobium camelthorni]
MPRHPRLPAHPDDVPPRPARQRSHRPAQEARIWIPRIIAGDELRAIKRRMAMRRDHLPWLFISERNQPFTRQAVNYIIATTAARARLAKVHPHMLRHSCGFSLANRGHDLRLIQDYLGHRDPKHTAHYTRVAARRLDGLWSS